MTWHKRLRSVMSVKGTIFVHAFQGSQKDQAQRRVCNNNDAQMFVTVWMGILDLSTGRLTAANAGHEKEELKEKLSVELQAAFHVL